MMSQANAQNPRGHIGISFGPSFPVGDLGSKDVDKEGAGWANPGLVGELTFGYTLGNGHFGLMGIVRGQSNAMDADGFEDELQNIDPTIEWDVEAESWKLGGVMFGMFGSLPVSPKAYFEPRFLLGFMRATSPEYTLNASYMGTSIWVKQSDATAAALAFLVGAGFKFDIGTNVYLLANLDYLGTNPEFKNIELTASDGSRFTDTFSQKMGTFNMSLGIALKL